MTLLVWQEDRHRLGVDAMDETHLAFADLVNRLGEATDPAAFQALFAELSAHTEAHFAEEDRLMAESGFPALVEHRGEHRRVLGQIAQIGERVARGRIAMGRAWVAELPSWFDLHAASMDSALAAHLKKASIGIAEKADVS
ncbi:bacteriohemerythrin [Rhodobium gokarnense]|uniref:Hemerythrin-like metal-binding protein n=1 Tax=Rhodobium gokarnense TaxID=364296 RepID=A0ABT3H986_9HYPH|nr:hemerythrin domain-containing protein [Rhodobium gokarnense]MCW2306919.1 hemerythrin-like metal-binding protein [Rhodobium gokarnense]